MPLTFALASMFINKTTAIKRGIAAVRSSLGQVADFEVTHCQHADEQGYIVSLFNKQGDQCGVLA